MIVSLGKVEKVAEKSVEKAMTFFNKFEDSVDVLKPDSVKKAEYVTAFWDGLENKQKDVCDKIEKDGNIDTMSTSEKGNYGEMKTDIEMEEQGWTRISTDTVTSIDDKGHQGIDGVYERVNPETGEKEYRVVESKYGTSELNEHTSDGKQMGENWIDKRLDDAVGKEKADEIRESKILNTDSVSSYISRIDKDGNVELTKLDSNANEIGGTNNER
jgi:hypothetical protein